MEEQRIFKVAVYSDDGEERIKQTIVCEKCLFAYRKHEESKGNDVIPFDTEKGYYCNKC